MVSSVTDKPVDATSPVDATTGQEPPPASKPVQGSPAAAGTLTATDDAHEKAMAAIRGEKETTASDPAKSDS